GKSTLLAKYARDTIRRHSATVVVLDFDRPGIDPNDPTWLEAEMTRQVGHQYREIYGKLREVRQQIRAEKAGETSPNQGSALESYSYYRGMRGTIGEALLNAGLQTRPLLLMLDTFEEVVRQNLVSKLIEWLTDLVSAVYPTAVRVIFSGR